MATAEEIAAKAAEFAAADANYKTAKENYEAALGPYQTAKQGLTEAALALDALDKEFEQLTAEYVAPTPPEPK